MVIDGNRLILIIGKKILFKKNSKSELSPKKIRPQRGCNLVRLACNPDVIFVIVILILLLQIRKLQ